MIRSLMIVEAELLMKFFGHEASLVLSDATIKITLDPKNPLTTNNILLRFIRDQLPSIM